MTNPDELESSGEKPRDLFFEKYKSDEDEYGFNLESYANLETFIRFFFKHWYCVKIAGLDNIPSSGKGVLFGNHSGVLPIDGCLLYDGMINYHPDPRRIRFLVTKFLLKAPIIGKSLCGFGAIPPDFEISTKLLNKNELVFFYPEAEKGTGKLFKDRYKLVEFNPGFVKAAIDTQSPLIPIVTIGGDEIYPLLADIKPIAKLMEAPYWPVTPFYPLLPFPFNAIPLPIKILICVGKPFQLKYAAEQAEDKDLVAEVSHDLQQQVQETINGLLAIRKSPFSKWDMAKVNDYLANTPSFKFEKHQK